MKSRISWLSLLASLAGTAVCVLAILRFVLNIQHNGLVWTPDQPARDHYLAVGRSYGQGFVVGFFLCFSLASAAVAFTAWREQRGRTSRTTRNALDPLRDERRRGTSPAEVEDC